MADEEVAPLNLSKKEPAFEVPLNLSLKPIHGVATSQTHIQGEMKNATWGFMDASLVKKENEDSTDEQKQTAAVALCQLSQWKQSEETEDGLETTTHFSTYTETRANNVLDNHQISSSSVQGNCITSNPVVVSQNKISTEGSTKTILDSTETDMTHSSSKSPDPKSALDVNCPTPHPEDTTVVPSEHKTKGQAKAGRRGIQNAKRSRDSIPSHRVLRKRLRC